MTSSLTPIAQLYGFNTGLFERALDGLDREQSLARPLPHGNSILWIAGHLASTRFGIARMLGREQPVPWGKVFHRGATADDAAALPELSIVLQGWRDISAVLVPRLLEITDAELEAPAPRAFSIDDKTLRGAVTFLAYHEGYHLGQISYVRRGFGLSGLMG
jgi:DinB superfamily